MDKFIVKCARKPRTKRYLVYFEYHPEIVERIKQQESNQRKLVTTEHGKIWLLHVNALYNLIKSYRKSTKIYFDFINEEARKEFSEKIKKIDKQEIEKQKKKLILEENKKRWIAFKDNLDSNYKKYIEETHKNLKERVTLYPYQVAAIKFIDKVKNVLLALDMGLGKSISSIGYIEMNEFEKVFVITPNSLKFNYYNEVLKFTHSKAHIITPKSSTYKNEYTIEESRYIIFNYDFFNPGDRSKLKTKLKNIGITKIDAVILDECQAIKNTKSNTYKNFKWLFKDGFFRDKKTSKVFMSGTPAPNKAHELYPIMNQISSIDFPNKNYFYEYYCGMVYDYENGLGWVENNDKKRLEKLFEHISPYTYRKRKKDVLHDLPDKTVQKIVLELSPTEQKEYDRIEEDVAHDLETSIGSNPLTIMLRLRQFLSKTKVKYVNDLIDSILYTGEKVVVVDMFKEGLYELEKIYGSICAVHTGDQKVEDRAKIVDRFQDLDDSLSIFAGSIPTCNYGLTLTAASKMIILTLPYSVGKYDQVMDRIHRISQKYVVNIYVIIFKDTIDEDVFTKLEMKRKDIVKVMDNEDYTTEIDESVLNDIVNKLINKYK